jgi:hypothetical protein
MNLSVSFEKEFEASGDWISSSTQLGSQTLPQVERESDGPSIDSGIYPHQLFGVE